MGGLSPGLEASARQGCLQRAGPAQAAGMEQLELGPGPCSLPPRGPTPPSGWGTQEGPTQLSSLSFPPGAFSHPGHEVVTKAGESSLLFLPKAAKGHGTGGSWPQALCLGPSALGFACLGNRVLPGQAEGVAGSVPHSPWLPVSPAQAGNSVPWLSLVSSPGTDCRCSAHPSSRSCL